MRSASVRSAVDALAHLLEWKKVERHIGDWRNERADKLAKAGSVSLSSQSNEDCLTSLLSDGIVTSDSARILLDFSGAASSSSSL